MGHRSTKLRALPTQRPFSTHQEKSVAVHILTSLDDANSRTCKSHNKVSIIIPANTRARYRLESLNISQALRSVGFR